MYKRLLALVATGALLAGLIIGVQFLPKFSLRVGDSVKAQVHQVTAKNLALVCPGSGLVSGGVSGTKVGVFSRLGNSGVDYSSKTGVSAQLLTKRLDGDSSQVTQLNDTAGAQQLLGSAEAFALEVQDTSGVLPQGSGLLAAQSFQLVRSANFNGLMASNCQRPTVEQWLLGANTTVGREALLILANPNPTDATVSLELFGSNGKIASGGNGQIAVAAYKSTVVPLAGLAPQEAVLAVRVSTSGASVASWVQQKTVRGTLAAGADLIAPANTSASKQLIPGLFKRGTKDATQLIKLNANYQDLTPNLAVFVPGNKPATFTAQVVSADPKTFGTVVQATVQGGKAQLFPLTGLKDGNYSIFVTSDQPILTAAQLSRTNSTKTPNTDFTWLAGLEAASGERTINVPKSGISKLSIANSGEQTAVVSITNLEDGKSSTVRVGRLTSVAVEVPAGSAIRVASTSPIASTLIVDIDWQLAALALTEYRNLGGKITVTIR